MKTVILLTFFIIIYNVCFAQFGFTIGHRWHDAPDFVYVSDKDEKTNILASTTSMGIDYQFRIKKARIEIIPEFSATFKQKVTAPYGRFPDGARFKSKFYNIAINTNFYILDFKNKCDCPAYYNDSLFINKGLFLQFSPGVSLFDTYASLGGGGESSAEWAPNIAIGMGLDIGLSGIFTITPLLNVRYFPLEQTWYGYGSSKFLQYFAGLRLGFRFDWI